MQDWLAARGESVPDPTAHAGMHVSHEMAGMATPEEMAALDLVPSGQRTSRVAASRVAAVPGLDKTWANAL